MRTVSGSQTSAGDEPQGSDSDDVFYPRDFGGGDAVDRFVILRPIGEGGMGVVYLAQDPELDRKVALKFLRPAKRRSRERLRGRLLREAQAMAQLNHPNVITVHAVGEFEGRIYLAMEFVEGVTLERWLKQHRRGWQDIVPMFLEAGRGLVAAHEQGLVHRDFKPDNVQVGVDGSIRVMDFGLVRPLGSTADPGSPEGSGSEDRDDGLSLTRVGDAIGTPAYMSPEQHLKLPADEASDQFAFCVSIYEALYRRRPFRGDKRAEVAKSVIDGAVRDPPTGTEVPASIHRIIVRGLARDPAQRWGSVQELLDALEGVVAPKPKWPLLMIAGVAVAAAGLLALVLTEEDSPCERATARLDEQWNAERRYGIESAIRGTKMPYVDDTWSSVSGQLDAWAEAWRTEAQENCAATHERGEQDAQSMDLRTACLATRADAFEALLVVLGEADELVAQNAARAVARLPAVETCSDVDVLRAEVPPPVDTRTSDRVAEIRQRLSSAVALQLAGKYPESVELASVVVTDAEIVGYAPMLAETRYWYGESLLAAGRDGEAEQALEAAYFDAAELGMAEVARDSASTLVYVLGFRQARHDEALQWAEHARVHLASARSPSVEAQILGRVGLVLKGQGRFEAAVETHEEALAMLERADGDRTLEAALEHANLSNSLREIARYDDAREHMERSIALREASLGERHPVTAKGYSEFATLLRELGQYKESLAQAERALSVYEAALGGPHPWLAATHDTRASTLMAMGRNDEALEQYQRSVAVYDALDDDPSPRLAMTLSNMGIVLRRLGLYEESIRSHRRALRIRESVLGAEHPKVAVSHNNLGACLFTVERYDEAAVHFERALVIRRKTLGPDHPSLANSLINLAQILVEQKRFAEALPRLREAVDIRERALGPDHPGLAVALISMAEALHRSERASEAIGYAQRAISVLDKAGGDPTTLAFARFALAESLVGADREHARALEQAELALAALEQNPGQTSETERVRAWVDAVRRSGRGRK